jgi:hypothetical protein
VRDVINGRLSDVPDGGRVEEIGKQRTDLDRDPFVRKDSKGGKILGDDLPSRLCGPTRFAL